MRKPIVAALLSLAATLASAATFQQGTPHTTNNDDSCDIAVMPAATLLLPYFEVNFAAPQTTATTTLFTVYNVTNRPQIAKVTVWTDLAFPVLDFNIFLTGYDVQAINLYDVLARGVIAGPGGTSNGTEPGLRSLDNDQNPNFLPSAAATCSQLPGNIPAAFLADIRTALTTGRYSTCGATRVGLTHANAIGYITIDDVATCSTTLPTDSSYYTTELLYDNVLGGDSMQINPNPTTGNYAGGNPLVHIRAIPEGGAAGSAQLTNLPYTFYDRYTPASGDRTRDRRQPLPSTFAARFIQGGTGAFNTQFTIWREGVVGGTQSCGAYTSNIGTGMRLTDIVRFDEHENLTLIFDVPVLGAGPGFLPTTASVASSATTFPLISSPAGDVGGWIYLNLNNGGSPVYSVTTNGFSTTFTGLLPQPEDGRKFRIGSTTNGTRQSQNWAVVTMFAEGRFSVELDPLALANGCTPSPARTSGASANSIGPGPNVTP